MEASLLATTDLLGLFSDGTRLRLLSLLCKHELSVAELTQVTGLVQSRVSTHLRKLREAQVVVDRRAGASTLYRLNGGAMPEAARRVWSLLHADLSDGVLRDDLQQAQSVIARRGAGKRWHERVAGEMERHYSPGRTWEAVGQALSGLVRLGRVLDVGCGDGFMATLLAPQAAHYTCLDVSRAMIEAAKLRLDGHTHIQFRVGEMQRLPFPAQAFDEVLMLNVLTLVSCPRAALQEAARVLAPGGRVCITTLDAHSHGEVTASYHHQRAGVAPDELNSMLTEVGLDVRRCEVTSRERKAPHFQVVTAIADKPRLNRPQE